MDKPIALWLAEYWVAENDQGEYLYSSLRFREETAAELRRLTAENELLKTEKAELLEAIYEAQRQLINLQPIIANGLLTDRQLAAIDPHIDMALQALASAEGEQR